VVYARPSFIFPSRRAIIVIIISALQHRVADGNHINHCSPSGMIELRLASGAFLGTYRVSRERHNVKEISQLRARDRNAASIRAAPRNRRKRRRRRVENDEANLVLASPNPSPSSPRAKARPSARLFARRASSDSRRTLVTASNDNLVAAGSHGRAEPSRTEPSRAESDAAREGRSKSATLEFRRPRPPARDAARTSRRQYRANYRRRGRRQKSLGAVAPGRDNRSAGIQVS